MSMGSMGNLAIKTFEGSGADVEEAANAFLAAHNFQSNPVTSVTSNWAVVDGKIVLSLMLLIQTPLGQGRPELLRAARIIEPRNGHGA